MLKVAIVTAAAGFGTYFFLSGGDVPLMNVNVSADAAQSCETLAAHPDDPGRPAGVFGVLDAELQGEQAFEPCRVAYERDTSDIRAAFHLGRAQIAMGSFDEGWPYVEYAAANGQPAALHLVARVIEENDAAPTEQILSIYQEAYNAGFRPAAADVERLSNTGYDYRQFTHPELVKALVDGDQRTALAFRVNVPHEALGLRSGLVRYVAGFSETLSGPYFCPGSLPAGVPEQLEHFASMAAIQEGIQAVQRPEVIKDWLERQSRDPMTLGKELIQSQMRLKVAHKAGERDAALVAKHGCDHAALSQIGDTLQAVANSLSY